MPLKVVALFTVRVGVPASKIGPLKFKGWLPVNVTLPVNTTVFVMLPLSVLVPSRVPPPSRTVPLLKAPALPMKTLPAVT